MTCAMVRSTRLSGRSGSSGFRRHRLLQGLLGCTLALGLYAGPLAAQGRVVTGQVVNSRTGQPLSDVAVVVAGVDQVLTTDIRGHFVVRDLGAAPVQVQLRRIGYRTLSRTVGADDTAVRFEMVEEALTLDEIVVSGTAGGTQARALGNVVGRIDVADVVAIAPASNVQQLLSGRVAGVVINPGSGNVGTGSVTRVRGISSLGLANDPLIYIDGVRMNNDPASGPSIRQGRQVNRLNDINPEDIASIEILKGPSAATLYGTEASNGVINIITKRGARGAPVMDVVVKQGATWLMSPEERIESVYGRDATTGELVELNLLEQESNAGRPVFTTGHHQAYSLALRGGGDDIRYRLSSEFDNSEGIVSYNWQKRTNIRGSVQITPSNTVDLATSVGWIQGRTRFAQAASGWGVWDQLVWGSIAARDTRTRGFLRVTPEAAGEIESYSDIGRFTASAQMTHRPFTWLTQRLTLGNDVATESNSILFPRHADGASYFFGALSLGDKTTEQRKSLFSTADYAVSVTAALPGDISSSSSFGMQYYSKRFENFSASGREFPAPPVTTVGGAAVTFGGESFIENKTVGMYIQEELGFRDRLFLIGALRGDDNSAFGENFDVVIYPKVSASWIVHEESFWPVAAVSHLKLRGAWGMAGQQPDYFAAIRTYNAETGPNNSAVMTPGSIGNPDLRPEKGSELELGFDAGLFEDRITASLTYYSQRTKDAILPLAAIPSMGFPGSQSVNLGEVSNRGLEMSVQAQVLTNAPAALDLGVTLSTNRNRIESLGGLPPTSARREGYPIGAIFDYRIVSASLDANGEPINVLCDGGADSGPVPCDDAPEVYWGQPTPRWEGSATTSLTLFNNLRLYGQIEYRGGHMFNHGDIRASHSTFRNSRAINEGTDPMLVAYDRLGIVDPLGYLDAGFAKLREISGTYTFPQGWSSRFGVSNSSLTLGARNVATLWVAQKHLWGHRVPDPEIMTPGSNIGGGTQTVIPPLSSLIATLRVTF